MERKISPLLGFDHRTVQPVASRYTDWAIAVTTDIIIIIIIIISFLYLYVIMLYWPVVLMLPDYSDINLLKPNDIYSVYVVPQR